MRSFLTLSWLLSCTCLFNLSQQSLLPPTAPDYVLAATATNITINCRSRYSVVVNGTSPGPTLYIKENYTSWIRVYNNIEDQNLTIHWHGLSERTSPFSDGTPQVSQWPIAPGEYFDYAIATQPGDAGSYFWHSHVGFQAVTATGVLIVEDPEEPPYDYDADTTFFFQDHYPTNDSVIEAGLVAIPFKWSGEPQAILVNGKSGNASLSNASDESCAPYVQTINPGQVYRMRFISNTALSLITLGIEDHDNLTIIEADGSYTKPWNTSHLQLGSGQRFSILFQAKTEDEIRAANKSSYWIRYENRDRPTNVSGYALLQYNISDGTTQSNLPTTPPITLPQNVTSWAEYSLEALNETEKFPQLAEVTRTVYITMKQVSPNGAEVNGSVNGSLEWAQDGLVWQTEQREVNNSMPYLVQVYTTGMTPNYTAAVENGGWDPYSQAFPALVGEVLDIVWLSNSGLAGGWDYHSMHAHGRHYWDLGSGNGTYNATENEAKFANYTPARRDTTVLYRYATSGQIEYTSGWRAWRIRIDEQSVGAWMQHCHQLAHMIMGMQTVWVYGNASQILSRFPEQPYVDGYLTFGGDAYGNATYDPFAISSNSTSP